MLVPIQFPANRFKEDVEFETTPQASSEHGKIKVRRTQNVENRRAWIQQWLHIEKIGRATCLFENPPANREPLVPKSKGAVVAVEIFRSSGAKHLRLISADVLSARPGLLVARTEQDLTQLRPSFGTEHHGLTSREGSAGTLRTGKPPYSTRQAIANQIAWPLVHRLSLGYPRLQRADSPSRDYLQ
jgi:hypothetical protein